MSRTPHGKNIYRTIHSGTKVSVEFTYSAEPRKVSVRGLGAEGVTYTAGRKRFTALYTVSATLFAS